MKPRKNEKRCCEELAVWSGDDYTDPAFMKPISREVTKVCTPRICNDYNNPWYNIGTSTSEKWINKLGLSWAKLSLSWGLKLEFEVEVELQIIIVA